ncbi:hypothetical protein BJV78DRAFT_1262581 [Lactifluus subvellereus]|nr:hypothetical protein BJV78DRAFT_1262581 [Lactifluus subvellereus]
MLLPLLPGHACALCVLLPPPLVAHHISVSVAIAVVLGPIVCRRSGTRGQPRPSVERSSCHSCCCCSCCVRTPLRSWRHIITRLKRQKGLDNFFRE